MPFPTCNSLVVAMLTLATVSSCGFRTDPETRFAYCSEVPLDSDDDSEDNSDDESMDSQEESAESPRIAIYNLDGTLAVAPMKARAADIDISKANALKVGLYAIEPADDSTSTSGGTDDTSLTSSTSPLNQSFSETLDPNSRLGSCTNPIQLPYSADQTVAVTGGLRGCSSAAGWCGDDQGTEDVYLFRSPVDRDVTLFVDMAQTQFAPNLRITQSDRDGGPACNADHVDTRLCAQLERNSQDYYTFFADSDFDYYIFLDSQIAAFGEYRFQLRTGPDSVPDNCADDATELPLALGDTATIDGELKSRQGSIDGDCGGPGHEQIYRVTTQTPGRIRAEIVEAETFISLNARTECSGETELACESTNIDSVHPAIEWEHNPDTLETLLVVDQLGFQGGDYSLHVTFQSL